MLNIQDSPFIKTYQYDNVEDFIKSISYKGELYNVLDDHFIFRGHSTDEYNLLPSALRDPFWALDEKTYNNSPEDLKKMLPFMASTEVAQIQQEYKLLQDFFRICDKSGLYVPHIESLRNSFYVGIDAQTLMLKGPWLPKTYWELAALAQHHGIRTRLLDWTYDIHVALYFAATGVYYDPKKKIDIGAALKAHREGREYPEKHYIEIWALNTNVVLVQPMKVPLHIIRPRYFNNNNLRAQKGVLTFWESTYPGLPKEGEKLDLTETDRRPLDVRLDEYLKRIKAPEEIHLCQILIPRDNAATLYSYIDRLGYNASTIFPGYDGVVRCMKERQEIQNS